MFDSRRGGYYITRDGESLQTVHLKTFLDALASLDFKLSVSERFTVFTASASTGLSELFLWRCGGSLFTYHFLPWHI